jgi:hypothetical protein
MIRKTIVIWALILISVAAARAQDPGWPRQITKSGGTLIYYQPQVDDWKAFTDISWRMAFSLTPAGGKQVIGVVDMQGQTHVDDASKTVLITDLKINAVRFPSLDTAESARMDQLARTFLPPVVTISLHRLVAVVKKPESTPGVTVQNDPPAIFVSNTPGILLSVDSKPAFADIPKTKLQFIINSNFPLFLDQTTSSYYLLVDRRWMTATTLNGPWSPTMKIPKDMSKVADDPEWSALKNVIPPPATPGGIVPRIFYSDKPADIILFDGKPVFAKIPGTQLVYSTNTDSYLFLYTPKNQYFYLTGGRWFRAESLQGPWTFATTELPADFANIPSSDPASIVLASVPGTEESKDAVLLAQVPTTMTVNPATAAANVKVSYGGDPQFQPISGTSMSYATNTQDKVIRVGDVYYLCLQGVWFMSVSAQGPWTVAGSVPQVIYTIPSSSPVYNVTYVTQTTVSSGVQCSYTAGYMGAFIVGVGVGVIVTSGSGYYYPPYIYRPPYGYPIYYPYPRTYGVYVYGTAHYNISTGIYGVSQTVRGPYGSATRGVAYNPYTGTSARYASVSTPYGSRSAGQAYNPYTGAYAATRQGSSPTAQWGSSVVSKNGQTAYTQHYSTKNGTVASGQTSSGGKVVGANTINGSAAAGKTSNGDMYATKDGNVYKNTGSGWQSYDNGNWNSVNKPTPNSTQNTQSYKKPTTAQSTTSANQAAAQQRAQTYSSQDTASRTAATSSAPTPGLQQEAQSRQRGAQQTQRYQRSATTGATATARRKN